MKLAKVMKGLVCGSILAQMSVSVQAQSVSVPLGSNIEVKSNDMAWTGYQSGVGVVNNAALLVTSYDNSNSMVFGIKVNEATNEYTGVIAPKVSGSSSNEMSLDLSYFEGVKLPSSVSISNLSTTTMNSNTYVIGRSAINGNTAPGIAYVPNARFNYTNAFGSTTMLNHYGMGVFEIKETGISETQAYMSSYFGVNFFTEGKNRMRINQGGIVSIGADINLTTPQSSKYKLYVSGGIRTEEVKIDLKSNWADYVFDDNYDLKSLKEVEDYVAENKHLPGIPSAQDVAKDGIEVGEMQKLQMEKIEELTLYTIQQQKMIDDMLKQNEILVKKVESLENTLNK